VRAILARTISTSQPVAFRVAKMLHTVLLVVLILFLALVLWTI
jgi:hypothetical protein